MRARDDESNHHHFQLHRRPTVVVAAVAFLSPTMSSPSIDKVPILRSWTPTTTQQLQDASSSCAFDVLDHVLVDTTNLATELTPWLSQLKPARTQGDVQAAELLSLLQGSNILDTTPTTSRGDRSIFISREERMRDDFGSTHPTLSLLIQSVETSAQQELSHCMEFDFSLTSVQLAVYPGDGTSGYPKHCDRSKTLSKQGMQRIITCVYYVTPNDWNADLDGGSLRVYLEDSCHYDVVPYCNRMVVFRSDTVEHQVLPSKRRERMALTIWLYGKVKDDYIVPRLNVMQSSAAVAESTNGESTSSTTLPPPLPVSDTTSCNDKANTIFVSIAAYRDSELAPTVKSLMATAQYPERITVGIVLQLDKQADQHILDSLPINKPWFQERVKILSIEARHARGPCYARALCQQLYETEGFVLQIDSHMRFRANWDSYLIEQLCKCPTSKSVLTAYPVGYTLPNNIPNETRGTLLVPWKFDAIDNMLRQRGRLLQPRDTLVPCHLYAAGFNFCHASVLQDVPYDGTLQYLFFGEEISMAVRLYTHGYNLYAPAETVVYHLWSRSHRPTPIQETLSDETKHYREQQRKAAREIVLQQLRGAEGLGTERSVQEFAEALGVDFVASTIEPQAQLGRLEADDFAEDATSLSPDSWEGQVASLDKKTQARIMSFLTNVSS